MIQFNNRLIPNHSTVFVAFSAGVDSLACLHFLSRANSSVCAFHFNHKLRKQNDEMQKSAEDFCLRHGIRLVTASAYEFPISKNGSLESCARKARLRSIAEKVEGGKVIFCHHLDDAIESYLMNCFNGVAGKVVIPPVLDYNEDGKRFRGYRPFLLNRKSVFEDYCKSNGLNKYIVQDETNDDTKYRRNFIRKQVWPLVKLQYPGLSSVVAEKVRRDYDKVCSNK